MRTRITIEHETIEALKGSRLWTEIMAVAFGDGPVRVIVLDESPDVDDDEDQH